MAKESYVICPNCGAQINREVEKCPYCGYINAEGAEKKYNENIEEIKDNTKEVRKEPARAFKRGLSKGVKVILKTVVALLVVGAILTIILAIELRDHPKMFKTADEEAYESVYKVKAADEMNAAYDAKDIEQMAKIYDKAYSEERVSLWGIDHYEAGYASSCYMKMQECLTALYKNKLKTRDAEALTYYCFYFYYRAYGDDGAEIFDSIRDEEIVPIIYERLGFTDEDMNNFRDKITHGENVVRSKVHRVAKKYYKNYH